MIALLNAIHGLSTKPVRKVKQLIMAGDGGTGGELTRIVLGLSFILIVLAVVSLINIFLYGMMAQAVASMPNYPTNSPAYNISQQGVGSASQYSIVNRIVPLVIVILVIIAVITLLFNRLKDVFGGGGV